MRANDAFQHAAGKLLAAFGESIIRWPAGVEDEAEVVWANVDMDNEPLPGQQGGGWKVRDDMGERINRTGLLDVAADQSLDDRDLWRINGEIWGTVREHSRDAGLITIVIERVDMIRTRKRMPLG